MHSPSINGKWTSSVPIIFHSHRDASQMELIEFGKICRCKKIQSRSVRYSSRAGLSKTVYRNEGYPHYKISLYRRIRFTVAHTPDLKWISISKINPLNTELNPICCLVALLGAHHFLHVSRIRVKSLTLRLLMSYIHMEHPFLMFLDHTRRRTTVGRTPLDE